MACQDEEDDVIVPVVMADTRECPLCGGTMRLKRTDIAVQIPGNPQPTPRINTEWVCPDCDYFEEVDEERS